MTDKEIIGTFVEAVKISSPSGSEKKMAGWVSAKMANAGWKVWEDEVVQNQSDTGNIYAFLRVNKNSDAVVFSAHLDTVQRSSEKISPNFSGKVFKSNGKTILGADNKAGVTSLVLLAKYLKRAKLGNNILFFFPTREEAGKMGSAFFDPGKLKVKYVFNVDSGDIPGVFVYKSLGYLNFKVVVKGLAVHAAKSYEKGRDAIAAAAKLVSDLPLGKSSREGWTLNLGSIHGGEAANVVCDYVVVKGELRGFADSVMGKIKKMLEEKCMKVAGESKCDIMLSFDNDSYISPFVGSVKNDLMRLCRRACERAGLKFELKKSFSTSDANSFSGLGYETVSVSRGGKGAHSKAEKLSLAELKSTVKLLQEICYMA